MGFSYDIATNITINSAGEEVTIEPTDFSDGIPRLNLTTRIGTGSEAVPRPTAPSRLPMLCGISRRPCPPSFLIPSPTTIASACGLSYGGHYGPGFMRFFQQQNDKIRNDTIDVGHAHYLHLDTLGIVNGCLDAVIQEASIIFPYHNIYAVKAFNKTVHDELMHNSTREGGCRDQIIRCQKELQAQGLDKKTVNRARALPTNCVPRWQTTAFRGAKGPLTATMRDSISRSPSTTPSRHHACTAI